jgi:hypothetical protein
MAIYSISKSGCTLTYRHCVIVVITRKRFGPLFKTDKIITTIISNEIMIHKVRLKSWLDPNKTKKSVVNRHCRFMNSSRFTVTVILLVQLLEFQG